MAARSVCVFGGSGFVGSRLCAALAARDWQVTVPSRHPGRAPQLAVLPAVRVVGADLRDPQQIAALCAGQYAVINLIGILNERGRDGSGFRAVHAELTQRIVVASRRARVERLLYVSALRADADHGASQYLRSKGLAERHVREESGPDLGWTILQPAVIFGAGDGFVNRFADLLRRLPLGLPLARPQARLAPVWVDDVVAALLRASRTRPPPASVSSSVARSSSRCSSWCAWCATSSACGAPSSGCRTRWPGCRRWSATSCPANRSRLTITAPCQSTASAAATASRASASTRSRCGRCYRACSGRCNPACACAAIAPAPGADPGTAGCAPRRRRAARRTPAGHRRAPVARPRARARSDRRSRPRPARRCSARRPAPRVRTRARGAAA
ncbi:MAG: NAD-dependent epimerase/dehydratase family protein [Gammaproteobacteria bacterium]|nr:NAD-dependent epimerase/dehydratase family protein [Gammaproteobacteria bacterium]